MLFPSFVSHFNTSAHVAALLLVQLTLLPVARTMYSHFKVGRPVVFLINHYPANVEYWVRS